MEKQEIIFYEDAKRQKRNLIMYSVIFYIGAAIWTLIAIFFSLLFPKVNLEMSQTLPTVDLGVSFPFVIFFGAFASFGMFLANSKKFMSFTAITKDKMIFLARGGLYMYCVDDLKHYGFIGKRRRFSEYKLLFADDNEIFINTMKAQELKTILDSILISKE